jgi:hypothetical protein
MTEAAVSGDLLSLNSNRDTTQNSNALRAVRCIPLMECTLVKQILKSFKSVVSQMTRNGSMRRSACLEATRQLLLRKLGCQGARLWRVGEADFTLDAPTCALKLEYGLCGGTACGKGVSTGKARPKTAANEMVQSIV